MCSARSEYGRYMRREWAQGADLTARPVRNDAIAGM
jgi:hypothetical protein